jgi:hypothetical protein
MNRLLVCGVALAAAQVTTGAEASSGTRVFGQPPYANITILAREKGDQAWRAAIPAAWRQYSGILAKEPPELQVPLYEYADAPGQHLQRFYRTYQALIYDARRCVGISMCTRGFGDTATGFLDYKMWYQVSLDGGKTYDHARPIVEAGTQYSPMHPTRHVWVGKNSFCFGAIPPLLKLSNGEFIMPCQLAPLDAHFRYYNPTGKFTFSMVVMMIGRWNTAGTDVTWESSEKILPAAEQSWRGFDEAGVVELSTPGTLLCVLRAGDGHQWKALSTDYGRTWSAHDHLTYSNGEAFWTPSSCLSIFRHSRTGKVYWIGNISPTDPQGRNSPRYPLVIAEVDEQALGLRQETVTIIDDRRPGEAADLQLSNWQLTEDAATGHIVLKLDRVTDAELARRSRVAEGAQEPTDLDAATASLGIHTYVIEVK